MSKKCAERLTDLEVQVMKVLWDSERAMTNSEIAEELKEETNLSVASVAQLVKPKKNRYKNPGCQTNLPDCYTLFSFKNLTDKKFPDCSKYFFKIKAVGVSPFYWKKHSHRSHQPDQHCKTRSYFTDYFSAAHYNTDKQ